MRHHATPAGLIPAIGYIRVSTWYEEKISDEIQKGIIADAAARRGRRIVDWIVDLDATGRNFRRKIMQAIEAVETGALEGAREIWVWKFSRFGRNKFGTAINLARIEQAGGDLISATEDVDARTATGEFTREMLFAVANFESNRAGEQWRETHQYRRGQGLPATGRPRFGYLWTPRVAPDRTLQQEGYDPDPDTHRALGAMYEMYTQGVGFGGVADWLNDAGHPTTRGYRWSKQTVIHYMDTGFAAGLLYVHDPAAACPDPTVCFRREHQTHIPAAHTPVIGDDLWGAYQQLREVRREQAPRLRKAAYPLSGLVRCGHCRGPAAVSAKSGKPGYAYRCSRAMGRSSDCPNCWVRRSAAEAEVYAWLRRIAREIDDIAAGVRVEPAPLPRPDRAKERGELAAEVARLASALDTASEAYALGDIPRESYLRTRDRLAARKREKEEALASLSSAESAAEGAAAGPAGYREVVEGLLEEWDTLPVAALRDLLAKVVREVVVNTAADRVPPVFVVPVWAPIGVV